ncbi:MAG: ATP-binding protein [Actinomycetota bacterium]|nr:ATP-binding protein [Actinomycetota bacterium]
MPGERVLDCLRSVPLFRQLSDEKLAWIHDHAEEVRLDAGTLIARQGDPPDGFYVVMEGETEWTRRVGQEDVFVVTLGEGTIFAELIMVLDAPYPTTGHAITDVGLLKLDVPSFWEMLRICPEVLRDILATSVERAELHESVSQQHGKLISLGTMAAGLAHELNNPAAAIGRSAAEAREAFQEASEKAVELGNLPLTEEQRSFVAGLPQEASQKSGTTLDSLEVSDLEDELAVWMEDHGVEEGWEISPTLAGAGLDAVWLEALAERLPDEALGGVLGWVRATVAGDELLREIEGGSARISELVGAIKTYTHMDRAASKRVDVHAGLDSTLIMLGHKLKKGDVEVVRDYEKDLPHVCGHAGELNQVWTNLIDNAIDAVDGRGRITVRTASENGRVLVEVSDDGPGIPEEVRGRIFEPFYTTKDVGEGTGLGLDISYRVVVEDHKGDIRVFSEPGDTRFQVRLPVDGPGEARTRAEGDKSTGAHS